MACTTEQQKSTVDGGGLLTENLILNHRLNEIWPGAIIPARSVATGGFGPALSPDRLQDRQPPDVRTPITLTLYTDANRFETGDAEVSRVIEPPTSDAVEQARVDLLRQVREGETAARMTFNIEQVHSHEHLDLHFGVDYNNVVTSIEGVFDYSNSTTRNKLLVKFYQVYYLMGVTFPNPHGNFVTDRAVVDRNDLLISDVAFGRLLLFSAESSHSAEDMRIAMDAAFSEASGQVDSGLEVRDRRVFEETRLQGQAIGGGATDALQLISNFGDGGLSPLQDYLFDGANYGPESPGAPIGFTARYLNGQDRANTYLTTEYKARNCYPKTREFRVHNVMLTAERATADDDDELAIYGDIFIWPFHPNRDPELINEQSQEPVWSRDRDNWVPVPKNGSKQVKDIDETVEFEIPDDQTWSEYMDDARIMVKADLKEHDWALLGDPDEWEDIVKTGSWDVTTPTDQTPTLIFSEHGDIAHLDLDVSPVPL